MVKRSLLLIVPYGIETGLSFTSHNSNDLLLIVPYGIETRKDMESSLHAYYPF